MSDTATTGKSIDGPGRNGAGERIALIDGATFTGKPVRYSVRDGLAIFEGDIVLGTVEEVEQATALRREAQEQPGVEAVARTNRRWRGQAIPYEIDPGFPDPKRATDAMAHWMKATNLSFFKRTAANAGDFPDYIRFVAADDCSSAVGREGGRQDIRISGGCFTGHVIHEIGHALGLWHEQSREDRDAFVDVIEENIEPGKEHNFSQHVSDGDDVGPYDYGSIMHYGRKDFSRNGGDTVVPRQAGAQIGQRKAASAGDVAAVAGLYGRLPIGRPYAYRGPVTQHVVYRSIGREVVELFVDFGGSWTHNIPSRTAGAPEAMSEPRAYVTSFGDRHHIVYKGMDRHVHELFDAGEWRWNPISVLAGAPEAMTDPFGYQGPHTQHVVYTSPARNVVELFVDSAQTWQHNLLDLAAGSPRAAGAARAYLTTFGNPHHVVYRGVDGHIHELFDAGEWRWKDLTAAAGAPQADSDPFGYQGPHTQHVVYTTNDGRLVELFVDSTDTWQFNVLNDIVGAPRAIGHPHAYITPFGNPHHIVYRGVDGHVHELFDAGEWRWNDLTVAAGAPRTHTDPVGYVDATQHVVFRSPVGEVVELYVEDDRWKRRFLTRLADVV